MRLIRLSWYVCASLAIFVAGVAAQTQTASNIPPAHTPPNGSETTAAPEPLANLGAEIASLRAALAIQQQQIELLQAKLKRRDEVFEQVPFIDDRDLKVGPQDAQPAPAADQSQPRNPLMETPLTIHFRGVSFTPGGFAAAEFVRRSRALAADVSTPFNSLTMPGASQSASSEFFGSARQSRPSLYVASRLKNLDLSGYISADFLSAGVTSTSNSTNGYTLRLRQVWGQVKFAAGWSVLGGQTWTLLAEGKSGIGPSDDAGKVNDARPMTIDSTYNVGFTYARQYGIRLTKDFGDRVWVAVSMENPQATLVTHNNAANFLVGQTGASSSYNSTANYSFNPNPDIIAKMAFEPGFGHYEVFGLFSRFRDRVFPCEENFASAACGDLTAASAAKAYNDSKNGGGFGANARWIFLDKRYVFGLHGFGGSGVGRYGTAQLPDVSVRADGTLALVKDEQGLITLERRGKKLDLYMYGGTEYASRTADFDPLANKGVGQQVGYGAPLFSNAGCYSEAVPKDSTGFVPGTLANCTADTRVLIEGTGGFWYRFYAGPRGTLRFGTQYSYVTRNTWSGVGGDPHGIDNMVFTSFRYYLP